MSSKPISRNNSQTASERLRGIIERSRTRNEERCSNDTKQGNWTSIGMRPEVGLTKDVEKVIGY